MSSTLTQTLARTVIARAGKAGIMITTAESCTGGLVSAAIIDISGSSAALDRSFVTYSNDAKTELLGVPADLIAHHGAVSAPVARAMAHGALMRSRAGVAIAITGIAGPDGGSADKPVGLVWFGIGALTMAARAAAPRLYTERYVFAGGGRAFVRQRAVETALRLMARAIDRAVP